MQNSTLHRNRLIIELRESDRERIFLSKVKIKGGKKTINLIKDFQARKTTDKSYSQTLCFGKVVGTASDVTNFKVGDWVIIDYLADHDEKNIVEKNDAYKRIIIVANDTYHTDDLIIPSNNPDKRDKYSYAVGDVDEISSVLAKISDGRIVPCGNLVMCVHHDDDKDIKKIPGIEYDYERAKVVGRVVAHAGSDGILKKGDYILADPQKIFPFIWHKHKYDFLYFSDVLMKRNSGAVKYFTK